MALHIAKGKYKAISGSGEDTLTLANGNTPVRSIRIHMLSGTAPIFYAFKEGSAPTAASSNGDDLEVLHDGIRVIELPIAMAALASIQWSFRSAAAGGVYIQYVI